MPAKQDATAVLVNYNSGQRLGFDLFNDETEQDIVGVAVVEFLARSEQGRTLEDGEHLLRGPNPGRVVVRAFCKLRRLSVAGQAAPHF